jgi:hypothetical protein
LSAPKRRKGLRLVVVESRVVPNALSLRVAGGKMHSGTELRLALLEAGFKPGDTVTLKYEASANAEVSGE